MKLDLLQLDREEEGDTWQVILESASTVRPFEWSGQVEVPELLTPPIAQKLAEWFLWWHRKQRAASFLGWEQLLGIASEAMEQGRPKLETDIEACPGIYVFVNLLNRNVLKVGQTDDMQQRIGQGHLRYGNQQSQSDLIVYCQSKWGTWPQPLQDQEITALLFPIHGSTVADRYIVEIALQELLLPVMP